MKKFKCLGISVLLLSMIMSTSMINADENNKISLPKGTGIGSIAYTDIIPEAETFGPESFVVTDNIIHILDTVDNQIEVFSNKGKYINTISLCEGKEHIDLEVDSSGDYFALTNRGQILKYNSSGKFSMIKEEFIADKLMNFYSLHKNNNGDIVLRNEIEGKEKIIAPKMSVDTKNKSYETSNIFKKIDLAEINNVRGDMQVSYQDHNFTVDYAYQPAGTYPMVMTKSNELLLMENELFFDNIMYLETRVGKYKDGKLIESALAYEVNKNNYTIEVPHKYIYPTHSGKVYQMLCDDSEISIVELKFSADKKTRMNEKVKRNEVIALQTPSYSTRSNAVADALTRAFDFTWFTWTYDPSTMKTPWTSTKEPPDHLRGNEVSEEEGIPYDWGGMNGVDTASFSSYANFIDDLNRGETAGDVECGDGKVTYDTAGVDCSGFISACYKVDYKLATTTMYKKFRNGTSNDSLVSGDIFNKVEDHVFMFNGWIVNYEMETVGAWTIESTPGGYGDKTKDYSRNIAEVNTYTWMVWK